MLTKMTHSDSYNEKLKDPRWQKKRLKIFERDNWACQLCSRTDLELNVHHLYRTSEEPWDEPGIHLLTLCRLCHEEQLANPQGSFKHPKRLYKTDDEWWKDHCDEYDTEIQEKMDYNSVNMGGVNYDGRSGLTHLMIRLQKVKDEIHALRLAWEEKGGPPDWYPQS